MQNKNNLTRLIVHHHVAKDLSPAAGRAPWVSLSVANLCVSLKASTFLPLPLLAGGGGVKLFPCVSSTHSLMPGGVGRAQEAICCIRRLPQDRFQSKWIWLAAVSCPAASKIVVL